MPPEQAPIATPGGVGISPPESSHKKKPSVSTSAASRRPSVSANGSRVDRPKRDVIPPPIKVPVYAEPTPTSNRRKSVGKATTPAGRRAEKELLHAGKVIRELFKKSNEGIVWPFTSPVDYVALAIPDYPKIIKKPMDLGTVRSKLEKGQYANGQAFEADVRLVISNCARFNPAGTPVAELGVKLNELFTEKWDERLREFTPEDDDDEDDEDDEEEEDPKAAQIALLQQQLASITQTLGNLQQETIKVPKKKKVKPAPVEVPHAPPKPAKPKPAKAATNGASASTSNSASKPAKSSPPQPKKATAKPKKPKKKSGEITFQMKSELAEKILLIEGENLNEAIDIIKKGMPHLLGDEHAEVELDIDLLDDKTLGKLYDFVCGPRKKSSAPPAKKKPEIQLGPKKPQRMATGGVARKQIDEEAQAAEIAGLEAQLAAFNNAEEGGPATAASPTSLQHLGLATGPGDMASSSSESEGESDSDSDSDEE